MPILALSAALTGCDGTVYVRDGVTDGDTFYLAPYALTEADPVLQSWVSYSLTRSACQLQNGGPNPARANSFDCELTARKRLLDFWGERRQADPGISDEYLDKLSQVRSAGYLEEYTLSYFGKKSWRVPENLDMGDFRHWRQKNLRGHKPMTRIIGSWNYAEDVKRE